ncbi:hypothetical protein KYB31_22780 [Clostridium felsineum]|uniref:hypothetical protein n=1 Tax=Clostridium felsineum TaxID=36839 RepID=UPI00214D68A6|nr:hypothetical protein [Clostridium felsineum]MCR3761803.1 hypothetical protein [Clostridium felsineum]
MEDNLNNSSNGFMDAKQMLQYMQTVNDSRIMDATKENNRKQPKILFGKVVNVTDNGAYADVLLQYGEDQVLNHIKNQSKLVLQVGDEVQLCAPTGDLTYLYIDQSKNPTQIFDAAKVKGTLTVGGQDDSDGTVNIMENNNNYSLSLHDHSIDFFDWKTIGTHIIGQLNSKTIEDNMETPVFDISSVEGNYLDISTEKDGNVESESIPIVRIDNKVTEDNKVKLNLYPTILGADIRDSNNNITGKGFNIDSTTFKIWDDIDLNGWAINNAGTINCQHLNVAGAKSCVQQTEHFGKVKFYSYEGTQSWLEDRGFGNIKDGVCIIYIDDKVQESMNTNMEYMFQFIPEEDCHYKIEEKTSMYVKITADKDIHFAWILSGLRRGLEHKRLENPDNLDDYLTTNLMKSGKNILEEELIKAQMNKDNKTIKGTTTTTGSNLNIPIPKEEE